MRRGCKKKPGPKRNKKSKKSCKRGFKKGTHSCKKKPGPKKSKKSKRKLNKYIKFANKNRKEVWEQLEKRGTKPSRMVPLSGRRLGKMYREQN